MKAQAQGWCSLGGQRFRRPPIQQRQKKGEPAHAIVKLIKEDRPGWVEEYGALPRSWGSLAAIRCANRFLKEFSTEQRLGESPASRSGLHAVKNVLWLDRKRCSIPIRRSTAAAATR